MARAREVEEPAPDVAVPTGGREADGGEAELRADGQPEILQHGSLRETENNCKELIMEFWKIFRLKKLKKNKNI